MILLDFEISLYVASNQWDCKLKAGTNSLTISGLSFLFSLLKTVSKSHVV